MSTLTRTHADPDTTSARRRWAVLAVVLAASVLDLIDATITNIAAPAITEDLGGGKSLVQWLGASYALALGVLLVVGGRLGDKYGRRRLFLTGLTGFTLSSIACGLAVNPESLVLARLTQGAFGALLIPQGFGILGTVFPRNEIGKAFSVFAPALGASSVGGPILAGFLLDADILGLGWRTIFLINIVLGGCAVIAAARLLPHDTGDPATTVDGLESALLGATMLGLLYSLIDGSEHGWTRAPLLCMAAAAACFALFCRRQLRTPHPLIEPSLLKNRGFTSGLILGVAFFAAVSGLLYVLSLFLQHDLGRTPLHAALGLMPISVGIVISSFASYRLIARLGRTLVLIGLCVTLLGTAWLLTLVLALGTATGGWALVPPAFVIGLGMGACFGTIYTIAVGDINPHEAGSASGSLNAVQQLANGIGAAAVTTVYFRSPQAGGGADGDARAMTNSLWVVAAAIAVSCCLVALLPRRAQPLED